MKKIILIFMIVLSQGCVGTKMFKSSPSVPSVPDVVDSFDVVDIDGNGTIDKEEYYANAVSINTDQPTAGLAWIVLSVLVCTFGAAIVYRKRDA